MSLSTDDRVLAGRYRLAGVLGSGGMAEVHRAWDVLLRRHVAVKVFQGVDTVESSRFDNEVRTLANLSHPGLVSVFDAGVCGGRSFVVLQLVDGPTLRDRLATGPLAPARVRALGAHLADALAHVHECGVVHRDVKPSNILLDDEDTPYLADFGLARSLGSPRLTNARQVVGTAAYLAPEQVRGEEVGPPADVYALGLVLLECLTGRREYQGSQVEAAVARLRRPPDVPRDLPADLARLLRRMTALSPRQRPTAAECARLLRGRSQPTAFAVEAGEAGEAGGVGTEAIRPLARSRTRMAVAGAAVLAAVGTAWAVSGQFEPVSPTPAATVQQPAHLMP
ncbi:serine/threonine-protein kinase [Saccharothrix syringae]|uniref:non-specific serine/threonine protein kinase n=1 Tax=Saccharothrix syringae TaxID=103733 RepID=A0A5Q0GWG8_SACSY|nr:serine/threonine-protein kinase [Saccharothrix syringae]QFZ18243.1 serine/threonine protein kinase [Saccharothrix syringae]